ncbi:MAG TPA: CDP-diacylglycerol--glycerol-3-phosphate 3-phosphatidyltransferase [Vicinamibacteria bacterium]
MSLPLNLPNALTALRILLVPILVVVLLTRLPHGLFLGAGIFGLGVATDYLDGYFARRRNQVTKIGILLDPLADKLLTAAAFISLVELEAVPAWMVVIIVGRELLVTGLRNVAAARGLLIPASSLGKGKMVAQVIAIFLLLLAIEYPRLRLPAVVALWVVVVLALVSAADYFRRFWGEIVRPAPRPASAAAPGAGLRADPLDSVEPVTAAPPDRRS